jgi:hypothetical protein
MVNSVENKFQVYREFVFLCAKKEINMMMDEAFKTRISIKAFAKYPYMYLAQGNEVKSTTREKAVERVSGPSNGHMTMIKDGDERFIYLHKNTWSGFQGSGYYLYKKGVNYKDGENENFDPVKAWQKLLGDIEVDAGSSSAQADRVNKFFKDDTRQIPIYPAPPTQIRSTRYRSSEYYKKTMNKGLKEEDK